MTIKELCKKAHNMAKKKGFWMTTALTNELIPRNDSELLMLVVTELAEACEALRTNRTQKLYNESVILWHKDTFEDEIADAFIRLADLCEAKDIDIEWQIKKKLEYNATRPQKHGKKF